MSLLTWLKTKVQRPAVEKAAPQIIALASYISKIGGGSTLHEVLIDADHIDEMNRLEVLLSSFTDDSARALNRILRRRLDMLPTSSDSVPAESAKIHRQVRRLSFKLAQRHIIDHALRLPGRERLHYLIHS